MDKNPVDWFEIYVQDMKRAKAFYETVFKIGLEKLDTSAGDIAEMWAFPAHRGGAGARGALVKMEGFPARSGGTIVYFTCDDCAKEASRATANGGTIEKDKFAIGKHGFIALVTDSEGNVVGLHSEK